MKLAIMIFFVGSMALLSGCTSNVNLAGSDNDLHPETTYRVIEIEGCEYIYLSRRPWSGEMALSHKGNCKNKLHNHR